MKIVVLGAVVVLGLVGGTSTIATENPMEFAQSEYRRVPDTCSWSHRGKVFFVMNKHESRALAITVNTRWRYNNQPMENEKDHHVAAGDEYAVGCDIPGPTGQRFRYEIIDARFL